MSTSNDDCYYFYYSTCTKGPACKFRHESTALGCEVVCQKWKQKNCADPHCSLRHMNMKKNRSEIDCYWQAQPGGCRKPHCVFRHTQPRGEDVEHFREVFRNAGANRPVETAQQMPGAQVGGNPMPLSNPLYAGAYRTAPY